MLMSIRAINSSRLLSGYLMCLAENLRLKYRRKLENFKSDHDILRLIRLRCDLTFIKDKNTGA